MKTDAALSKDNAAFFICMHECSEKMFAIDVH